MPLVNSTIRRFNYHALFFSVLLATTFLTLLEVTAYLIFGLSVSRCVFLGMLFIGFLAAPLGKSGFRSLITAISRMARHRALSVAIVGLTSFLLSAALSMFVRMPEPSIHDEFSYLLASDTYAHGRLTNPTHPMWKHLESFHVIFQPTYASKYPPAQGLVLAAGQVITGHPIVGVWLSTALACGLICWMLMAWMPPRWALLGGFLALLHPMILSWSQSYWGGSVAMAGGALTIGAFRRTFQEPRTINSILMGLGMAVMANSRPYEGFVLSLLLTCALVAWAGSKRGPTLQVSLTRIVVPVFVILALTAGAMAFYNRRVTGNAFEMPYMLHEALYAVAPPFLWQHLRPEPVYYHKEFYDFYVGYVVPIYTGHLSVVGLISNTVTKLIAMTFSSFWLLIPSFWLLAKPSILRRDGWMRFVLIVCLLFVVALLLEIWVWPHYAAPVVGLVFVFSVQALRYLRSRRYGGVSGRLIMRATLAFCITSFAIYCIHLSQLDSRGWNYQRAGMVADLARDGNRHLIIVRYGPDHDIHQDWVFNDADIDGSKVVWARDMGAEQNKELLDYFKERRVWLLEVNDDKSELVPYSAEDRVSPAPIGFEQAK